jgi:transcriptional regulator with XRE-family HTH domain
MKRDLSGAYATLRRELINAREAAKLSQEAVAKKMGKRQQFVSKIETGERRIDVVELMALAPILKLDVEELLRKLGRATK